MTRNAIIVHGMPSRAEYYDPGVPSCSNHHWLPWLAKQFLVRGIPAHTPEMPHAYAPDYPAWVREFERYDITAQTVLVGHSCGGGFLLRWLSEHPDARVGRVVLVAPWLDPDRSGAGRFFVFHLDPGLVDRTAGVVIFSSDDDSDGVLRTVDILRERLPGAQVREFAKHGHFLRPQFPELLVAALS